MLHATCYMLYATILPLHHSHRTQDRLDRSGLANHQALRTSREYTAFIPSIPLPPTSNVTVDNYFLFWLAHALFRFSNSAIMSLMLSAHPSTARPYGSGLFTFISRRWFGSRGEHTVLVAMLLAFAACLHATFRYDVFSDKGWKASCIDWHK